MIRNDAWYSFSNLKRGEADMQNTPPLIQQHEMWDEVSRFSEFTVPSLRYVSKAIHYEFLYCYFIRREGHILLGDMLSFHRFACTAVDAKSN
jgi:hypothetical protein